MKKSTMVELVQELELIVPRTPAIEEMITEAKAGEYHDYKNQKYVCGKVAVVGKLQAAGLNQLAERVADGEFDEEADEEDKANLKRDALAGGFSEEQCKILFGL
ncbi:hypothetical protein [Bdellovibrio bacteriovorus]|uniref:hypothetical protein n=1 Tax=Bdellovibrio bacteriovorus TaxID=959 RepID=UPI0035A625D2